MISFPSSCPSHALLTYHFDSFFFISDSLLMLPPQPSQMTCQDSASPAHSPNTLVPEMLPYLHQHPALPHHLYFLQSDSSSHLPSSYHDQSTFQHDQHVNPPEFQYHRQDFHDHQLQNFNENSKNALLFQVQCYPTFPTSQNHSPNNAMNNVQMVRMPLDSSPLNVAHQENNDFSSPIIQLQTFHMPQFPQNMTSHPPPVAFSMPYPNSQQNSHDKSCSTPPSYGSTSIPPASSFLSPCSNFHCSTPLSVAMHQNRIPFQQPRSYHPSNSHNNSNTASSQFSHNINHNHHHHHSASQPQRQSQQSSSTTCLSFSRRVVKPSQLDLARQRLSSVELPDVLTPEPPQLAPSSGSFAIHFK